MAPRPGTRKAGGPGPRWPPAVPSRFPKASAVTPGEVCGHSVRPIGLDHLFVVFDLVASRAHSGSPDRGGPGSRMGLRVGGDSFRPQISAHTGTKIRISVNTSASAKPGPAILLTFPCARRTGPPPLGESRMSMTAVSGSRLAGVPNPRRVGASSVEARWCSRTIRRCAHRDRHGCRLGMVSFAQRHPSQRTPAPPPERHQRRMPRRSSQ